MKNTNLGTLGKVLNILRETGINDIPETDDPFSLAMAIVLEVEEDKLNELMQAITGENKIWTDDEGVSVLQNFFTNLGENLSVFVDRLTKESREQKLLVIQMCQEIAEKSITEITTSTDFDFLLRKDSPQ